MESRDKREELAKKIQALGKEEKEKIREYRSTEYKKEKEQLEHDSYKEQLEDLKQERLLRRKYARSLFILLCIWLLIILLIVVFQGFNVMYLSDAVLITLITTTTANIAAYFINCNQTFVSQREVASQVILVNIKTRIFPLKVQGFN